MDHLLMTKNKSDSSDSIDESDSNDYPLFVWDQMIPLDSFLIILISND